MNLPAWPQVEVALELGDGAYWSKRVLNDIRSPWPCVCVGLGAGDWAIIFVAALVTQQQAVNCLSSLAIADLGNLAHHPGLTSEDHATITSSIYLYIYIYIPMHRVWQAWVCMYHL